MAGDVASEKETPLSEYIREEMLKLIEKNGGPQEREENEATAELLSIPGFEAAFRRAVKQVERGEVVCFEDVRCSRDIKL